MRKKIPWEALIGWPPYLPEKQDILKALHYYIHMGQKYGVNFKLGTEVTETVIANEHPDVVILATGSLPLVPNIKGIKNPGVMLATDLLEVRMRCGNKS